MYPFLASNSFHDHCYLPLYTFYAFELFCSLLFGCIFHNVVETSPNLAVDAADVAGKMAHTRREATQSGSGARKKATQGGISRKGNQSSPRRSARKTAGRKRSHSSSCSSSSVDSSVVSE
jgi:type IV secretory pathway VirB6-like protein